jgi:xylulokinase
MYLLGYDIGSSSVKASLVSAATGECIGSAHSPKKEMAIEAGQPGWAEQDPMAWWDNLKIATGDLLTRTGVSAGEIKAIGISYQMHGLVCIDRDRNILRPSIIWCDSRAVAIGEEAFRSIGPEKCLGTLLNSPGNFTASKLRWVKDYEPAIYEKIWKIMLPGDFIAMKLTGEVVTTVSGLSEGMFWDFKQGATSDTLLQYHGFASSLLPEIADTFSVQGKVSPHAAVETGLTAGTPVSYRAGDQPNNAFSLNVLEPGEIAATAGTSGVVYGVSGEVRFDPKSRVNTFAHVNHKAGTNRLGVLLCINGTGILNAWLKYNTGYETGGYEVMNEEAARVAVGSDGLVILPFGNGSERVLGNLNPGGMIALLDFNRHTRAHLARAAQEGIVFSFCYGMEVMRQTGIIPSVIRAGFANMFLSPLFREALACTSGASIELYNTDGSQGAALGAGVGTGIFRNFAEAFAGLRRINTTEPDLSLVNAYREAYQKWLDILRQTFGQS